MTCTPNPSNVQIHKSQNTYPLFIACIQLIWLWPLWQTISGFSSWAFRAVWKQEEYWCNTLICTEFNKQLLHTAKTYFPKNTVLTGSAICSDCSIIFTAYLNWKPDPNFVYDLESKICTKSVSMKALLSMNI